MRDREEIEQLFRGLGLITPRGAIDFNKAAPLVEMSAASLRTALYADRSAPVRLLRLLRAYEAGYRPDDWPKNAKGTGEPLIGFGTVKQFNDIAAYFDTLLLLENGEALICWLYDIPSSDKNIITLKNQEQITHIPEACNLAKRISAIGDLLKLPNEDEQCERLQENILISLDVLREHMLKVYEAFNITLPPEKKKELAVHENIIRGWSGFLKHPCEFVSAHRCLDEREIDGDVVKINTGYILKLSHNTGKNWKDSRDNEKKKLQNAACVVEYPDEIAIKSFLCAFQHRIVYLLRYLKKENHLKKS